MFDLIEESTIDEKKDSSAPSSPMPLEGTVYTMPAHRPTTASVPDGTVSKKKSGSLVIILAGVGIVVLATVFLVWWVVFPPTGSNPAPIAQQPAINTEPPPPTPTEDIPVTPPSTPVTPEPAPTPPETPVPAPSAVLTYVKSPDSDGDDLTDTEEKLFNTDDQKPDTDVDAFLDGAEIKFLYDPTKAGSKLETSSTVNRYKNSNYAYSLLYPSAWVVDSVDKVNKEVIFSAATGEFFNLTVQDNPEKLSALEWYTTVHKPNTDTASLQTMKYDTWTGVMSENGLEVYMTANDDKGAVITPYVYVLTYDVGNKKEMNFGAVFQMMIRSFLITDLSFQR